MRLQYTGVLSDGNGTIISGALVKVYLAGTATPASIYTSPTSTTVVNSVTTGTDGSYTFFVDTWDYGSYQTYKLTFDATALGFSVVNTLDNVVVDNVVLGTYTISTAKVAAYPVRIPKGVVYSKSGSGTLTFSAEFEAGQYQVFSGFTKGVDVTLSVTPLVVWDIWFDGVSSTHTIATATITTAAITTATGNPNFTGTPSFSKAIGTPPFTVTSTTPVANLTSSAVNDGSNVIRIKVINIGDWNMDSTSSVTIAHGLTVAKIRTISVTIINDASTVYYDFYRGAGTELLNWDSTNVDIAIAIGSYFDDPNFDSTSFNRGWITITYVD